MLADDLFLFLFFFLQENIECDFPPLTSSPAAIVHLIDAQQGTIVRTIGYVNLIVLINLVITGEYYIARKMTQLVLFSNSFNQNVLILNLVKLLTKCLK